jgi:divalent metal cation (Fe/Co/Zn/Cd) transporter
MKQSLHYFLALLIVVGVGMLWRAGERITNLQDIPEVHATALIVAVIVLIFKELLFRYMLRAAERVRSALLIANAWHARSDAASSLVVAIGIIGVWLAVAGPNRGRNRRFDGRADGLNCRMGCFTGFV